MNISLRPARGDDLEAILLLLRVCNLPDDIKKSADGTPENFFVITVGGKVIACAGLELYLPVALVRSLAVDPTERSRGFGANLLATVVDRARELEVTELYGLTTTAQKLLQAQGFEPIAKSDAPRSLLASMQLQGQCSEAAQLFKMHFSWRCAINTAEQTHL